MTSAYRDTRLGTALREELQEFIDHNVFEDGSLRNGWKELALQRFDVLCTQVLDHDKNIHRQREAQAGRRRQDYSEDRLVPEDRQRLHIPAARRPPHRHSLHASVQPRGRGKGQPAEGQSRQSGGCRQGAARAAQQDPERLQNRACGGREVRTTAAGRRQQLSDDHPANGWAGRRRRLR